MDLLWRAGRDTRSKNIGELARHLGGEALARACDVTLLLTQCSFCATYFVFISQCVVQALKWILNCNGPDFTVAPWPAAFLLGLIALLAPLSMVRQLEKLAPAALMADVLLVICLGYLFWLNGSRVAAGTPSMPAPLWIGSNPGVAVGTALYSFEGVGMVLPLASVLKDKEEFPKLLLLTGATVLTLYASFGFLGGASFGHSTQTTILMNLNESDPSSPAAMLLQLAWAVAIVVTFPIQLSPAAGLLEHWCGVIGSSTYVLRFAMVVTLAAVAETAGPFFNIFISLAGAFCCLPLAFIYPPLLHLLNLRRKGVFRPLSPAVLVDVSLLLAGGLVFGYVVISTFAALGSTQEELPCLQR
eukprot:Hpha_TRINITY_DN9559_c0_g1::TRINITY_DN9559_c0_g1_i1::g.114844::m.114844/K14209/SLC36A, PAT; solute carrier family 36 (proton-coupled amino acid transporter)